MECSNCGEALVPDRATCPRCDTPTVLLPPPSYLLPPGAAGIPATGPAPTPPSAPPPPSYPPPPFASPIAPASMPPSSRAPAITLPRQRRPWRLVVALMVLGAATMTGVGLAAAKTIGGPSTGQTTSGPAAQQPTNPALPQTDSPTDSPTGGTDGDGSTDGAAAGEAQALNAILTASGTSRANLATAINAVNGCTADGTTLTTISGVLQDRSGQIRQAQSLAVPDLPGGASLRDQLVALLQKSAEADGDYQSWAEAVIDSDCAPDAGSDDLTAANTASAEATTLKTTFLATWNPEAATYGLPQLQEPQI
jgi:hypothetical protein